MSGPSHRRDDNPKQEPKGTGAGHNYLQALNREVLDQPSIFVASIVDLLGRHGGEDAKRCADIIRRQGAMTGREFTRFIEGVSDPVFISELLRAYSVIFHDGIDVKFAQGVPALITLAQRALTSPNPLEDASQERLVHVLDRVLKAIDTSDDIAVRIEASVRKAEFRKLGRIATHGFSERRGYWECVEFLCALYPEKTTLQSVFQAIERVGSERLQRVGCYGAGRCIAAVASLDYAMAFTFVAHTLHSKDRSEDAVLRRVALSGLALQDAGIADILGGFLASRHESEAVLACQVWERVVLDQFGESSAEQKAQVAQRLRSLIGHQPRKTGDPRLHDAALTALMYTSTARKDIDAAGAHIRARLAGNEPPPSSLVAAYAKALSQIEGELGIKRFKPLSRPYLQRLISPPSLSHHLGAQKEFHGQADTDNVFKSLAIQIAGAAQFEDVLALCGRQAHLVNLRCLRERDNDSLSLFVDVEDAARFCDFYAHLAESGPAEFALVLLPELLSALDSGRDFDQERSGDLIGEKALEALKSITCSMLDDANARELALARMSLADWKFLSTFHKINIRDYPGSYPELALVVFALRSVLEGEQKKWQRDLISWWRKVDDAARNEMDSNALRFVSVVAERHRSGAVWDLISRLSLVTDDGNTLRNIASGVVVRTERSIQKICDLVTSPRGDDLARGFSLAQLMSRYVSESQREEILVVARRSLDEIGALALDAITTVASLSCSVDDAALLLAAEPCLGLKESAYRVSCARAAAHVLLNREQRQRDF